MSWRQNRLPVYAPDTTDPIDKIRKEIPLYPSHNLCFSDVLTQSPIPVPHNAVPIPQDSTPEDVQALPSVLRRKNRNLPLVSFLLKCLPPLYSVKTLKGWKTFDKYIRYIIPEYAKFQVSFLILQKTEIGFSFLHGISTAIWNYKINGNTHQKRCALKIFTLPYDLSESWVITARKRWRWTLKSKYYLKSGK